MGARGLFVFNTSEKLIRTLEYCADRANTTFMRKMAVKNNQLFAIVQTNGPPNTVLFVLNAENQYYLFLLLFMK